MNLPGKCGIEAQQTSRTTGQWWLIYWKAMGIEAGKQIDQLATINRNRDATRKYIFVHHIYKLFPSWHTLTSLDFHCQHHIYIYIYVIYIYNYILYIHKFILARHTDNHVFMFGGFSPSPKYGCNITQCFDLTKLLDVYVWTNGREKIAIFLQIGTKIVET